MTDSSNVCAELEQALERALRAEQRVAELERLAEPPKSVARPSEDVDVAWSCNCAGEIFIESTGPGSREGVLRIGHFQGDETTARHVCSLHNASLEG
jgi:hypothetical protein